MSRPPHVINEKKDVVFDIKGGNPITMGLPTWLKSLPDEDKGLYYRCEDIFYKLRAKVND